MSTPRLCATKQLYEQISCDDPELEARVGEGGRRSWGGGAEGPGVDRERRVWEGVARQGDRITGSRVASARQEYRAHEADIKVGVRSLKVPSLKFKQRILKLPVRRLGLLTD